MSADDRRGLGKHGEDLAAEHLAGRGYRILARNYRCPAGEADLVAQDGDCLVIVEVKTRRSDAWGLPEEAVTPRKQQRLLLVAEHYMSERELADVDWRIDVVAIEVNSRGGVRRLEVYQNAVSG